ncbi:hypothetical protein SDC9_121142 [bioreactor metagenome]|uniref:Uncharacterized protein n=1 Tax=bioreactor metagenome TaxID=1076179 RepID=A0A645CB40_9ZZZZ
MIRGVGRVPGGVLEDIAPDHRRGDGAVVAESDHRAAGVVARRQRSQPLQCGRLVDARRQAQPVVDADGRGHRLIDQFIETRQSQTVEHPGLLDGIRTDVAVQE